LKSLNELGKGGRGRERKGEEGRGRRERNGEEGRGRRERKKGEEGLVPRNQSDHLFKFFGKKNHDTRATKLNSEKILLKFVA
jgi:hypothetical protein